jgi:translation initiation factor 4A
MNCSQENEPENEDPQIKSWDDMNLKDDLLRGIYSNGFETPSEIQKKAIIPLSKGRDLLAQAQSGSGKTGSFTIGALQIIDVSINQTQVLILVPTHELARQITLVVQSIGSVIKGLVVKTIIGGTSVREDVQSMEANVPHLIVGCVGRVCDMISKRYIDTTQLKLLILDEADEMLTQGFGSQIRFMFKSFFPEKIQVALFSATMPDEMVALTGNILRNPVHIRVKLEDLSLKAIDQYYIAVADDNMKYSVLKDLFAKISVSKCIIYCNSVKRVETLGQSMARDGFSVCCIHSGMEKEERTDIFNQFRNGQQRALVSSDITARGIDIQQVSVVVNFDVPKSEHTYLHRIGRSGRWGRKGFAINLVSRHDMQQIHKIESNYKITIAEMPANFDGKV